MEVINTPWMNELQRLVKARINAVEEALKKAKADGKNINETEEAYTWANHMGTTKIYSKRGMAAMKEFVRMYEAGELNCADWESKITHDMWVETAVALYFGDVKSVYAGITFIDVRDYIFSKIA